MTDKHIMLDLETMGTGPAAAIVAIGAVEFDFDTLSMGSTFIITVDLDSAIKHGGVVDGETVMWWMKKSDEARYLLTRNSLNIGSALDEFDGWIDQWTPSADVFVWGNAATFDNAILRSAYERLNRTPPWSHWNDRCYRTLKSLAPDVQFERHGTYHNALDDAISQALHARQIMDHIRKGAVS